MADLQSNINNNINLQSIRDDGRLGCVHYIRNCKIRAECCKRLYVCRLCHDEKEHHEIDRFATKSMICMSCNEDQPTNKSCFKCGKIMGKYFCNICKFWNDDSSIPNYHCSSCGICRKGKGLGIDYFHCEKCNCCISISIKDSHICREGASNTKCPICWELLFTSVNSMCVMKCGHHIHKDCMEMYMKNGQYNCPTCFQPIVEFVPLSTIRKAYIIIRYIFQHYKKEIIGILILLICFYLMKINV